jgi:hypothetical protein
MTPFPCFIGWDSRQALAWQVSRWSLIRRSSIPVTVDAIKQTSHPAYTRRLAPTADGLLWDGPSNAFASTEFATARFLVPFLCERKGFALFADSDMLWKADVAKILDRPVDRYAVMVVKHRVDDATGEKMDGQVQQPYARKNWSSLILWNCEHPAHDRLTMHDLNTLPGRDLHRFSWLKDEEIGELPVGWNWLEGYSDPDAHKSVIHYTRGGPWMPGWENVAHADEWVAECDHWRAAHGR